MRYKIRGLVTVALLALLLLSVSARRPSTKDSKQTEESLKNKVVSFSIIKNEATVLPRMLASLRAAQVDAFIFCDTGSTDGTQAILKAFLEENSFEGGVFEHAWVNFGHNLNLCLDVVSLKQPHADYIMRVDADFVLNIKSHTWKNDLVGDQVNIAYEGEVLYRQPLVFSARKNCRYVGVTHEYLSCRHPTQRVNFDGISMTHGADGGNRAEKFERDAALLRQQLEVSPNDPRTVFYMARTLEDQGKYNEAIFFYEHRAGLGGWYEEAWYGLYKVAVCKEKRGDDLSQYTADYLDAFDKLPSRLEPLFRLTRAYRLNGKYSLCLLFGTQGMTIPLPKDDILFVERSVYEWQLKDEVSQCLGWTGKYAESIKLLQDLLRMDLAEAAKKRFASNLKWAEDRIQVETDLRDERQVHDKSFTVSEASSSCEVKESGASFNRPHPLQQLEFIHITKSAGTAIEAAAAEAGIPFGYCHFRKTLHCANLKDGADWTIDEKTVQEHGSPWHFPPKWFGSKNPYLHKDTFTVVRNPYDRLVSMYYCYWVGYKGPNPGDPANLNAYTRNLLDRLAQQDEYVLFWPQYDYAFNPNGSRFVTHILRFESLSEQFASLMQAYDLNITLPRKPDNAVPRLHTEKYDSTTRLTPDDFSRDNIRLINELYEKDFTYLNYSMRKA